MSGLGSRQPRLVASILLPALVLGAVGVMALPAAAGTLGGQTVTSGDARFQVLSPTLIRTEFAGDGSFTDAATFNAIGRDDFDPKPFTRAVKDGWLTIDTGKMVIRYKEGSGAFTPKNLTVALTTGSGQKVTGAPWAASALPECAPGVLCETESLSLHGLAAASDHTGYTGTGFVAGYEAVGNALAFTTKVVDAGDYDLALRYANNRAGDGQITTRTLSVVVDDQAPQQIQLAPGDSWDAWKMASAKLKLSTGEHHVTVERTSSDSGNVNIDSLAVVPSGAPYPTPSVAPVVGCAFGVICEAETSSLKSGATLATDHNGFSGGGFVAGLTQRASLTTHVTGVPADGAYALQVRYANGQPGAGTISVQPNDGAATAASLAPTSGWDYWRTVSVPVQLSAGDNDVTIGCPNAGGCNLNIDTVAFAGGDVPLLAPHAALGGYRRDLDTANGTVKTNPGLLFQDGWSLVDDTASSLYDVKTKKVTPRGDHGGKGYLDGYVFGYGNDYATGLADLTRLTGPSALLPRWAYGVWYSEYFDRTQAQFTDSIVPRFSAEGVPVDVVAIDTDYKAPDKWNGWEVDPSRFPDMKGFLAWLHKQGIHNTLNIHPSISTDDPKLAAAQATAGGTLTKSGDNYLFDWSDPLQLKAYFDLHNDTQQAGADIWWLDWCCSENSKYSENGVTPDAYINSQYAQYTNDALDGRGFAFSRAYGSLTAGGYGNPQAVPTGPWADKRTTLHFTGDTVSTWQMLQAEVGYTPGESASTGLAAISHDIGGHTGGTTFPGAEPGSTQLAGDLYARWVQLGAFQPIDRLHSNHSDRLPWQYGASADASATKFLNLRENLVPLTYTLAAQANATGIPIVRPLYLQYPDAQEAYAMAGREYLYGPDVLVAPVTSPGETATTTVWFPGGSDWTDYFTGRTYQGGTTADVTTDLNSMPVFVRGGGIVPTRTKNVANDSQNPLDAVTLTVAGGASGSFELYEDSGKNAPSAKGAAGASATTAITYTRANTGGTLDIARVKGSYPGKVTHRAWATAITNVDRPTVVSVDGKAVGPTAWSYNADARTLTVQLAARPVSKQTSISFRS
jgi:alpha-glucosidase (family GH31 glycosyl hydrolase)